jgi:Spy/CpxP family protein refolding chaperone
MKVVTFSRIPATLISKAAFENAKKEAHMKQSKFLTVTLVVVIILACAVPVIAGGFCGTRNGHWGKPGIAGLKIFLKLDLTDAQRSQLIHIIDTHQDAERDMGNKMFEGRRNLLRAMHSEKFNEANIRKACKQISSIREDSCVLRARLKSEMKAVLTPAQMALLQKGHRGDGKRMRHRLPGPPPEDLSE